ncbi:hypothetical protein ALP90_200135 [Pseudomonas amygdali pv. ulmi]|uniref:Conjugal transfer protein n=1 Tax=Pseudomonas amygdali pv. ulmi TaxID=251720 RepID=A0A3M4S8E3_PSEA0|nr:VirB10/TraB/TrbI family type IV secretion system protein [Pseudomonas amygdali]RMR11255.1 hypothetical protein ALP90_200135 [Pseudomonas amygdali pv. ulmi]
MTNNSAMDSETEQINETVSVVQGSPEPEINKHKRTHRLPMIYKLLGGCVVLIMLGYVGFKLYGLYRDVTVSEPAAKAPESSVTSSKRRVDLGQNTQFFEKEPVTSAAGDTGDASSDSARQQPSVADMSFKKYLSIPVQEGSGSNRSSAGNQSSVASEPVSEPAPPDSAPPAVTEAKEVTGMKVESIAMDPNLYIEENTYIPCTLQNRFVSDVAGRISCVISEDVYSANGHVKLLEKGTKAFGIYRTGTLKQGQGLMFVAWDQLRTPDFKKIKLFDTQVVGQLGESGIDGWIDEHFWERFKGALLLSTVQDVATAFAKRSGNQSEDSDYTQNTREGMAEMSNTALENSINIPPTLYKNQGDIIGILVGEDIDFSGVYTVRLKK